MHTEPANQQLPVVCQLVTVKNQGQEPRTQGPLPQGSICREGQVKARAVASPQHGPGPLYGPQRLVLSEKRVCSAPSRQKSVTRYLSLEVADHGKSLTLTEPSPTGGRWGELQQPWHLLTPPSPAAKGTLHGGGPQEGRQSLPHEIKACTLALGRGGGVAAGDLSAGIVTPICVACPRTERAGRSCWRRAPCLVHIRAPLVLCSAALPSPLPLTGDKPLWQDTLYLQGPKGMENPRGVSLLGRHQSRRRQHQPRGGEVRPSLGDRGSKSRSRGNTHARRGEGGTWGMKESPGAQGIPRPGPPGGGAPGRTTTRPAVWQRLAQWVCGSDPVSDS